MGYGHERAAWPVARMLGAAIEHADRAPLADAREARLWAGVRRFHEVVSKGTRLPSPLGRAFSALMDAVTYIPRFDPSRDDSAPNLATRWMDARIRAGVGHGLVERLRRSGEPLFATFYTPAVAADRAGLDGVHCLVTDTDCNRVWVQSKAAQSRAVYFAPTERVRDRLATYGVRPQNVVLSGFPLADSLVGPDGAPTLRRNLAARLARLGEKRESIRGELGDVPDEGELPPLVTFAVGGAGAQVPIARALVAALGPAIREGRLRLALVAGIRREVREALDDVVRSNRVGNVVQILWAPSLGEYFDAFDALVTRTDVLWTKPSELVFFAALGLPLVLAPHLGAQEIANREWILEHGAGIDQGDAAHAGEWLLGAIADGTLARAAWAGFRRLEASGTYRILDVLGR